MVKLRYKKTTDTEILAYNDPPSCILSSGEVVVCGTKTDTGGDDSKFYLCDKEGKPTGRTINTVCGHSPRGIILAPMAVDKKEYLSLSCHVCRNIRLINLETNKVSVACRGIRVYRMCLGESDTLYTMDRYGLISVFDISGPNFTLKCKLSKIDENAYRSNMCYMNEHDMILLSSYSGQRLCAMRSSDGQIVWNKPIEQIDGKVCMPLRVVYLPQVDSLIVGDEATGQIVVLSGKSGDVVQTVEMKEVTSIRDLHVRDDELMLTLDSGKKLSN